MSKEDAPNLFQSKRIKNEQIVILTFKSQKDVCKSMLRLEEFYESPQFNNKYFTLAEYKAWYKSFTGKKTFTYYSDWGGFNIPIQSIRDFYRTFRETITHTESQIVMEALVSPQTKYLIALYEGADEEYLTHELAHAAYSIDPAYRSAVECILADIDLTKFKQDLRNKGYAEHVLIDEIQAYSCDGSITTDFASEIQKLFSNWRD